MASHMHDLPLPTLLDHMGAEDRCNEEEKDAKQWRSASTTPRSAMGTQPNDHDRVMGVTSVGSQESVRFGEESDPESDNEPDRAADSSEELEKTCDGATMYHDANPGVDEIQGKFGSASLRECLDRITQPATSPSTLCSGVGLEDSMSPHHTKPPQVMSPNLDQTQPQNPASMHDPPPVDTSSQQPKQECKEEPLKRSRHPNQSNSMSRKFQKRKEIVDRLSSDPMHIPYMQDTSHGPSEAP